MDVPGRAAIKGWPAGSAATAAIFFVLALVTRYPFADPMLYNIDSIHFALALDRFDVSLHLPHPPGYILYIMLGRAARYIIDDANQALVAVSMLFGALLVSLTYHAGSKIYGRREGVAAGFIALSSPLVWFHGIVGLSYIVEGFMSLLIAFLCIRILSGERGLIWAAAVAVGLAGGIRQGSMVFLLPVFLYAVRRQGVARIAAALAVVGAVVLSWFVPVVQLSGGYEVYSGTTAAQTARAVWRGITPLFVADNMVHQIYFTVMGLMFALVPLALSLKPRPGSDAKLFSGEFSPKFLAVWIGPSLLFYFLILTQGIAPGYGLIYMPGLFLVAGRAVVMEADRLSVKSGGRGFLSRHPLLFITAIITALNAAVFLASGSPFSPKGLDRQNRLVDSYVSAVRQNFPPDKTVLAGSENFFISYRHAAYYAPEYPVYYVPAIESPDGRYFLRCKNRATEKTRELDVPEGTRYLVHFVRLKTPFPDAAARCGGKALDVGGGDYLIYYDYGILKAECEDIDELLMSY